MSGRGRGGRGGRGRGGGPMQSYMKDELQLTQAEYGVTQPPPLYPPLEYQPQPLPLGPEYQSRMKSSIDASSSSSSPPFRFFREVLAENWKKELRYLFKDEKIKDIERYTDRYEELPVTPHRNYEIDLSRIPRELWPTRKRSRKAKSGPNLPKKKRTQEDGTTLMDTLEELEKKETLDAEHEEVDEDDDKKKKDGDDDDEDEEADEDNESDYEDDNDYVDNYFDNGEDYGDASDGSGAEAVF